MKWNELVSKETMNLAEALAEKAYQARLEGRTICPPQDQIFRALELTPPEKVKVCMIGQDPYHTPGQANGLAFSITNGRPLQPSLRNIFKELVDDVNCGHPTTSDLTPWAEQGVLLLNTTLTVEAGMRIATQIGVGRFLLPRYSRYALNFLNLLFLSLGAKMLKTSSIKFSLRQLDGRS